MTTLSHTFTLSLLLALALGSTAHAQVYKCKDPSGRIIFSDIACDTRSDGGAISVRPNSIDASGSREQALSKEVRDLREQLTQPNRASYTAPAAQEDKANSSACKQATRSYENEAGSIRKDTSLIDSKRSAMFIACGQQEPAVNKVNINNNIPPHGSNRPATAKPTRCDNRGCWDTEGRYIPN